jgi:hypothetical protein
MNIQLFFIIIYYTKRNDTFLLYEIYNRDLVLVEQRVDGVATSNSLDTTLEPQSDFLLGVLNRVGTVTDVTSNFDTEVTTDGTRGRGQGVGLTQHLTTSLDGILTSPDHTDNGARGHVFKQRREERLGLQVTVL